MQSQLEGQQIGRYLIRQRLGGGGVATVYQAYDQVSGHSVALKVLPPNPDEATLNRFRREALMAGALRHPNIVRILQVGTDGPAAYIAMDLVEGESLAALLARFGQLRAEESCRLLEPIARALAYAHAQGVVHRDVKPSNILLRPLSLRSTPGETPQADAAHDVKLELMEHSVVPLLSDFGIARFLDAPELTNAGRTVGTPAFMAPEQCMGSREVDGRADIYSLGTVLYRCVVGRLPFNGSTTQILHAHVFEPVVIDEETVRQLPPKVVEILRRTLAKAPEERYQSVDALADELATVGSDAAQVVLPEGNGEALHTATMTLAQVTTVTPQEPSAVQVLVPGTTNMVSAVASATPKAGGARKRGPSHERLIWAALYLFILVGGGFYAAQSWYATESRLGDEPLNLPLVAYTTFTPTPLADDGVGVLVPVSTTVASEASTPVAVAATSIPTATPIPAATAILVPSVEPSPVPPVVPTATSVAVVETPTPIATPLALGNEVVAPGEEIAGVCATVVDNFFLSTVAALSGSLAQDFACPTTPAQVVGGEWVPFTNGMMVAVDDTPLVYVAYANGSWEQVARAGNDGTLNTPGKPLPAPFGGILSAEGRHLLLGDPKVAEPMRVETLVQPFGGGVLVGNRSTGEILILARSTLRF